MRERRSWLNVLGGAFFALSLGAVSAAQALTQDLTSQFAITRSGLVLNRTTNTFDSTIALRNSSDAPVLAPIDVVVGGLPTGVTLANKTGDEPDGRPFVSPMAAVGVLQPGGTLNFVLKSSCKLRCSAIDASNAASTVAQCFPSRGAGPAIVVSEISRRHVHH